jgi:hypothetical protein
VKVRMQTGQAGPEVLRQPGDVVEVSPEEGARLVEAGAAVEVSEPPAKPPAKPPPERARRAVSRSATDAEAR